MYGWKLDVDKGIPYYPLKFAPGAKSLEAIGVTPLRVSRRVANSLLWDIFLAHNNSTTWVERKVKGWKSNRNHREAETLARVLDLAVTEFGAGVVEKSASFEVLLRRLHAINLADKQGHWKLACLLEEVPSELTPELHDTILKESVTTHALVEKVAKGGGDANLDGE